MKNVIRGLVKYFMMAAVMLMLGFGGIGMASGQAVVMAAESVQETGETASAEEDEQNAVLVLVLGGGLIIILTVVISVVSTVVSSVASAVEDED